MASKEKHTLEQLRKARSCAKSKITRKVNRIRELMNSHENLTVVKDLLSELNDFLQEFRVIHESYHSKLDLENDLRESDEYCLSVELSVKDLEQQIDSWLKDITHDLERSIKSQNSQTPLQDINIQPEDSISNVGSRVSTRASSSRGSLRSAASSRAKAAAKKAVLEAQVATLERLHALEIEELKLQQRKKELHMRGEIAAAEAEREVYERVEVQEANGFRPSPITTPLVELPTNPLLAQETITLTKERQNPITDKVEPSSTPVFHHNKSNNLHEESLRQLVEMQDRQSFTLQQLIVQQQQGVMALTLPQPSMQVFSGNPIDYCDFIRSFEHLIESKTSSPSARLYYLIQHTSGPAQELMKSCLSMREDESYTAARKLLKDRFGQNYRVAAAHIQRLIEGPPIKHEDGSALQQFAIQLTSCTNVLEKIGYLDKLNNSENLKKIIDRLPYSMRVKWRDNVDRIIENNARDANIKDINEFVTAKARATTHPVFGNISAESKVKMQNQRQKRHGFSTYANSQGTKCSLCGSNHWLSRCDKFRRQSLEERQKFVREKKLCNNCLSTGHFVRSCPKDSFCKVQGCSSKHSTFLHPKNNLLPRSGNEGIKENKEDSLEQKAKDDSNPATNGYVKSKIAISKSVTGLAIVPVQVKTKGGSKTVETYAFLDSGSNTTFCTDDLLKRLGAQGKKTRLSLTTMQGENTPIECSLVSLKVADIEGTSDIELPLVYSRPTLPVPSDAISKQEDVNRWPYLHGVKIAHIDSDIGLLIGCDVPQALQPYEVRKGQNGGPFATRTALGWVLNGPLGRDETKIPTSNYVRADQSLEQQFESYCNREFNDSKYDARPTMSQNDRKALEIMERTVTMENGHYQMALPWKTFPPNLPNNKPQAKHRLQMLKNRLLKNPELLEKYKQFMNNLLTKDYASEATEDVGQLETHWYLPHHPVFHPQKPGKLRVVFDCSAEYHNTSLNKQLLQGPDLTNSLVGVLTRFRQEPIAFISDIEAMFHQVRVQPSDRDALRFLWWKDGDLNSPPKEYKMNVHLFGSASSPSCSNFALKKTAADNTAHFDDQTIETVQRNFYVDDCLKSVGDEDNAVKLAAELRSLLALGGFNLTKWLSNSRKVIESLPESERAAQVKDLDFDKAPIERALGVRWNVASDTFGFAIVIKDRPLTRRGILSIISSIYDPLGFVAPFILTAKLILQDLCRLKLGWDDKIPDEFQDRWQTWLSDLPQLEQLAIDRCFKPLDTKEITSAQLHHFSDASQQGYGAVSYIRVADKSGKAKCSFVLGKSRLAPLKPVTIPRMELSAAVVSTKLERMLKTELTIPIDQSFFWTDSTCVLRYIENKDKRFQTFVANRIATIHDASSPEQWNYVDTNSNPADDASRGVPANALQRWIAGPEFLTKPREVWPQRPPELCSSVPETDPEIKKGPAVYSTNASVAKHQFAIELIERFSCWNRLKRVFAWLLRYKNNLRQCSELRKQGRIADPQQTGPISPLSLVELVDAEKLILKYVQDDCFSDELRYLKSNQDGKNTSYVLSKSSSIVKLDPIVKDGLIRVGGRLQQASIDSDAQHPIILPKNHHVAKLITKFYHLVSGHSGLEHTLSLIRQRYWIIRSRPLVRKILHECVSCRKRQSPAVEQKMASLPKDRVTPDKPPFTYTGVDCFGPFDVRRGRGKAKRYGVIFTCLTLRAIHIEVANSLDTESFINALRRFIARRGRPEEMRSDNGGNFVKGERELREEIKNWNQTQIHDFLVQRNVKWTFNPPAGSHHGGVWERCIRTVRKVMRAVIKEQLLDDEGINTLMCEVEAIVNGRPLTKLSEDPRDLEPLTPNHLLLLRNGPKAPPGIFTKEDNCSSRRWRQVQYLADVFWRRWIREYLPSLQERQKWNKTRKNLKVNDIVLILDEKTPRCSWPLGRIMEVYTNRKDGLVRSVKVKTSTSLLIRPVDKIILLESEEASLNDK